MQPITIFLPLFMPCVKFDVSSTFFIIHKPTREEWETNFRFHYDLFKKCPNSLPSELPLFWERFRRRVITPVISRIRSNTWRERVPWGWRLIAIARAGPGFHIFLTIKYGVWQFPILCTAKYFFFFFFFLSFFPQGLKNELLSSK